MECEQWQRKLSLFQDGELGCEEIPAMQSHLQTCPACAELARSFQKLDDLFKENLPMGGSEAVVAKVMAHVGKPSVFGLCQWSRVAAACMLFMLGGILGAVLEHRWNSQVTPSAQVGQRETSAGRFPYMVDLRNISPGYYITVQNEAEEKKWHQFLQGYARQLQLSENQRKLNRYRVDSIPASLIHYADF